MTEQLDPKNKEQLADCEQVRQWFTYHKPHASQVPYYNALRDEAGKLALSIVIMVPRGVERDQAINHLRAAIMFANAGIACSGAHSDEVAS